MYLSFFFNIDKLFDIYLILKNLDTNEALKKKKNNGSVLKAF